MRQSAEIVREIVQAAERRGVDFADVRVVEDRSASARVEDGRADKVSERAEIGACVRVLVDGAWGFVSVDSLSRRQLLTALDEAIELAKASSHRVSDPGVMAAALPAPARQRRHSPDASGRVSTAASRAFPAALDFNYRARSCPRHSIGSATTRTFLILAV